MSRLTFKQVNSELARLGIRERLVQGPGYLYFTEGNAVVWYSSSIPVARLNHIDLDGIISWHTTLSTDYRNF